MNTQEQVSGYIYLGSKISKGDEQINPGKGAL